MPSSEEVAHAFIDVSVNTAECRPARSEAEVVRPAKQIAVQSVAQFRPRVGVAGHQQLGNIHLESVHTLLGRARAQIPSTVCFITVRSERVAEEVEALVSGISSPGLDLTAR